MNRLHCIVFSLIILLFSGCAGQQNMEMAPTPALPTPVAGQITVINLMAPVAPAGMTNGSVYFIVQNGTDQLLRLQSVTAAVAESITLHETVNDDGIMRMIPQPDGFAVPAGESLILEPSGKHVMLEQLYAPLSAGDQFTLTLNFADGEALTVTVPVMERGVDPMDHSMEHNHK